MRLTRAVLAKTNSHQSGQQIKERRHTCKNIDLEINIQEEKKIHYERYVVDNETDALTRGLWDPKVHCRPQGSLIIPFLSRNNLILRTKTYLFKNHSNIILPSKPRSS